MVSIGQVLDAARLAIVTFESPLGIRCEQTGMVSHLTMLRVDQHLVTPGLAGECLGQQRHRVLANAEAATLRGQQTQCLARPDQKNTSLGRADSEAADQDRGCSLTAVGQ